MGYKRKTQRGDCMRELLVFLILAVVIGGIGFIRWCIIGPPPMLEWVIGAGLVIGGNALLFWSDRVNNS